MCQSELRGRGQFTYSTEWCMHRRYCACTSCLGFARGRESTQAVSLSASSSYGRPGRVTHIAVRARDGHEALEYLLVQDTLWILRRLVGHKPVDEGEGGLRHCHAGERTVCM